MTGEGTKPMVMVRAVIPGGELSAAFPGFCPGKKKREMTSRFF